MFSYDESKARLLFDPCGSGVQAFLGLRSRFCPLNELKGRVKRTGA